MNYTELSLWDEKVRQAPSIFYSYNPSYCHFALLAAVGGVGL